MGQNALSQLCCRIFKSTIFPEQIDEIPLFFTFRHKFVEIRSWLKFFQVGMVNNGYGHFGHEAPKLALFQQIIMG